jgi:hypothetical protein
MIAKRLDVDADDLRRFVEFHPDPDVSDVVAFAETVTLDELDATARDDVARWIADVREKPAPGDLPGATPRLDGREFGLDRDLWWDHHYEERADVEGADARGDA